MSVILASELPTSGCATLKEARGSPSRLLEIKQPAEIQLARCKRFGANTITAAGGENRERGHGLDEGSSPRKSNLNLACCPEMLLVLRIR